MNVLCAREKMQRVEISVKKSRFIASIFYVETEDDVKNNIKKMQKEFYDAKHHVYAYVIGDKKKQSDDGEPSGTGGKHVLNLLESKNMTNCLIVVSRIFGGILLGTGGLSRAYAEASKMVLEKCETKELIDGIQICIKYDYSNLSKIKTLVESYISSKIENIEYGDIIYMVFFVKKCDKDNIVMSLKNVTNGKIEIIDIKNTKYVL